MIQAVAGVIAREEDGGERDAADTGNDFNGANEVEMHTPRRQHQLPNDDSDGVGLIGAAPAPLLLNDRMSAPCNLRIGGRVW